MHGRVDFDICLDRKTGGKRLKEKKKKKKNQSASRPTNKKKTELGDWQGVRQESKGCKLESSTPPRSGAPTELYVRIEGRFGKGRELDRATTDWSVCCVVSIRG